MSNINVCVYALVKRVLDCFVTKICECPSKRVTFELVCISVRK